MVPWYNGDPKRDGIYDNLATTQDQILSLSLAEGEFFLLTLTHDPIL